MNKSQAGDFINLLSDFVDTCINARNMRDATRQETRRQYADMLKTALVKYTEPEPTIKSVIGGPSNPQLVTKDGCSLEAGIKITLYRVLLKEGNTLTVTGTVAPDGWLETNGQDIGPRYAVAHLYATRWSAWEAHQSYRANGGTWSVFGNAERVGTSTPAFNTKDMQAVKVGSIQTLWMVMALTGEITHFTGRVDMKGNLFEIVGAEGEDIVPTFPINELYFWRVNLLKDELATQSTSTVVEVEYSDNAEIETETEAEYD